MSRILLFVALLVAVAVALPAPQLQGSHSDLQWIVRTAESEPARLKRTAYRGYGGGFGYGRGFGGYGGFRGHHHHHGHHHGYGHRGFGHRGGYGCRGGCGGYGGYGGGFANSAAHAGSISTPFGSGSFATAYANSGYGR
ncbi:PREDICTED: glycine-rich RNA-binding protein 3, mitochondrial-like [Trachymyrmex septentrionalis]|uniref:glycine-rich RNA-binding protein 3, mitochondrial-like n=1 Tax=Trachymyrmex septentrionalis TaxID=34720 RepID=UPI00084F41DA|nr:PREDICTED: glycine-rich RNA-binding protein 3, mitochondrial-like [Trachymyrmex septentrionalis]